MTAREFGCECWWGSEAMRSECGTLPSPHLAFSTVGVYRDVLSVCVFIFSVFVCVCARLAEKVFVYEDEEKRYSHIRRCLATVMHRLWRTSVVAAAAKLVLYSKQCSRSPPPAPLLFCAGLGSVSQLPVMNERWWNCSVISVKFSWPWLGLCGTESQGHRVLV